MDAVHVVDTIGTGPIIFAGGLFHCPPALIRYDTVHLPQLSTCLQCGPIAERHVPTGSNILTMMHTLAVCICMLHCVLCTNCVLM